MTQSFSNPLASSNESRDEFKESSRSQQKDSARDPVPRDKAISNASFANLKALDTEHELSMIAPNLLVNEDQNSSFRQYDALISHSERLRSAVDV